jgi:predicted phosphodiesterase
MDATSPQSSVWKKIESYTLRLRNKKKVINTFMQCGIRLVLHGHSHEAKEYSRKGLHFVNAGGSIESETESLCFYIIDYKEGVFETTPEIFPWKAFSVYQLAS